MKRSVFSFLAALALLASSSFLGHAQQLPSDMQVTSPNGQVHVTFALDGEGRPTYAVDYGDATVIAPSTLGLVFKEHGGLDHGLRVTGTERTEGDETYEVVAGKSSRARAHYEQLTVDLEEEAAPGRRLRLVLRAYDEGAALRYVIPEQPALDDFTLAGEQTTFELPDAETAWALQLPSYTYPYEGAFPPITLDQIEPASIIGLPLTVELAGGPTITLAEANLTNYAGMYLEGLPGRTNTLVSKLSPSLRDSTVAVVATAPQASPWRVVMIGEEPADLIASDLLLHLNAPPAFDDLDWIEPGKSAWDWWSNAVVEGEDFEGGMNQATMKHYVDFAADLGLEFMLVDAGWYGDHNDTEADITTMVPAVDIPALVEYANERDVDILLWLNWKNTERQRAEAFPLYEEWGVRGIKIDYMNRDDQQMVGFYHETLREAAEHHLMVNYHGAYKPTGIRRTYPHLMTREGIMGLEYTKWSGAITPEHNVTIPFTRMLAGPMDYTPGAFDNVPREAFEAQFTDPVAMGTRSHQLAMYVVYESPQQMVSDHPSAYRAGLGADFIRVVPASWDETRPLAGAISDYVALARRRGDDWFVGAMTDWTARSLTLPLDFLEKGATYRATVFQDDLWDGEMHDAKHVRVRTFSVTSADELVAAMASGGGYAVHLTPVE